MSVICLTSQVTNELWIVWTGPHVICVSRCSDWQKRVAVNNNRESQQTHWARLAMYMCSLLVSASYGFLFWGQKGFFFLTAEHSSVLCCSQSVKKFSTWWVSQTNLLVCLVPRFSQLTWERVGVLWTWQMVKQTSISCPVAKTDQARQTFSKDFFSYFGSTS